MSRRATARRRPAIDQAPRIHVVHMDTPARTSGGFMALLESATQQTLAVTYWFDPVAHVEPSPVTVRFSGRHVDVKGRLQSGDRFVQDETIENVVPGSGPISLTARVRGINPGEWAVTAHMLGSVHPARVSREQENAVPVAGPLPSIVWLWRKWAPPAGSVEPVRTCLIPLALCAGDPSRHLGSDGDAGYRYRADAPVPGDFRRPPGARPMVGVDTGRHRSRHRRCQGVVHRPLSARAPHQRVAHPGDSSPAPPCRLRSCSWRLTCRREPFST